LAAFLVFLGCLEVFHVIITFSQILEILDFN
jgi:hypothetical protein